MHKKFIIFIILLLAFLINFKIFAQKEGNIWCFGDSAGINFNYSPPKVLLDGVDVLEEATATISDKNGNLFFMLMNRIETVILFAIYIWAG